MENAVEIKKNSAPARDISVITQEIQELCRQAKTMLLMYAVEIGRRLVEAKEVLPHGEWGKWIKENTDFSQPTANNYMRLFDEYGASQITIFGATVNSQSLANLPYSKALALLAVDADDRETFAEKVGAEDLSVKELETAIRERDAERARRAELEEKLMETETARNEYAAAAHEAAELTARVAELEAKLEKEKGDKQVLKNKLSLAKDNPKIPQSKLDEIKREAADAAKKEIAEQTAKELEEARAALDAAKEAESAANAAKREAEEKLAEAQARLKTASPEINAFKVLFEAFQEAGHKCRRQIEKIREGDPASADKLLGAMAAFAASIGVK